MDFSGFINDFLNDAREGFQELNTALLALEKDHRGSEHLDEIFRIFHTLKSSSTMLRFSNIAALAHIAEDLLDRMRKHTVPVNWGTIDVLFEVTDTLEAMVKERAPEHGKEIEDWQLKI